VSYDPGFAYELAVIVEHGMRRMLEQQHDVFFYITAMNENHAQPSMPEGVTDGIVRGAYRLPAASRITDAVASCTLLGSGAILHEVIAAAELLAVDWRVQARVLSVTSFCELARDGIDADRRALWGAALSSPYIGELLAGTLGPIVAATDYVRAVPEQIRAWVGAGRRYATLGTDGFGRSDSRAQLREHFEVSRRHVALAALHQLALDGQIDSGVVAAARSRYGLREGENPRGG
jgi:pyruvate dehydrogenase E1 component